MKKNIKRILIALVLSINFLAYSVENDKNSVFNEDLIINRESVVINEFKVVGNNNVDISNILNSFNIKKGDEFDRSKLENLMNTIVATGYFETAKPNISIDSSKKSINIILELVENRIIKKVNLEGINSIDKNELLNTIGLKEGSVFNYSYVDQEKSPILLALREKGIYMPIILSVNMNKDNELNIKVSEGKVSKIEFIKQGEKKDNIRLDSSDFNLKTKDFVLERNLEIKKDDYLTTKGLKTTSENLLRTGLFESVEPKIEIDPLNPENRIVIFVISERRTASINASGSYSTSSGFVASTTLKDENFLGGNQTASISASVGTTGSLDFRLSYMNPWIIGTSNILAGGDIYYKRDSLSKKSLRKNIKYDEQNQINGLLAEYIIPNNKNEFGLSGTVGKMIYKNLYLNVNPGLNYEFSKTKNGLTITSSTRGYTNLSLNYTDVDNPYMPRKGNRVRASIEGVYVFQDSSISDAGLSSAKTKLFEKQKEIYNGLSEEDKKKYFVSYDPNTNSDLNKLSLTSEGENYVSEKLKDYSNEFNNDFTNELNLKDNFKNHPRLFSKFEFDYINYTPIIEKINSLATRIFVGKATLGADRSSLFPVKGNGTFLRGFDTADVTNFLIAGSVENRFYLNKYVEGVIFLDTGLYAKPIAKTKQGYDEYDRIVDVIRGVKKGLKMSLGAGIRVNTPIGILRLDYGVPVLNNTILEGRGKLEFGLSESF